MIRCLPHVDNLSAQAFVADVFLFDGRMRLRKPSGQLVGTLPINRAIAGASPVERAASCTTINRAGIKAVIAVDMFHVCHLHAQSVLNSPAFVKHYFRESGI